MQKPRLRGKKRAAGFVCWLESYGYGISSWSFPAVRFRVRVDGRARWERTMTRSGGGVEEFFYMPVQSHCAAGGVAVSVDTGQFTCSCWSEKTIYTRLARRTLVSGSAPGKGGICRLTALGVCDSDSFEQSRSFLPWCGGEGVVSSWETQFCWIWVRREERKTSCDIDALGLGRCAPWMWEAEIVETMAGCRWMNGTRSRREGGRGEVHIPTLYLLTTGELADFRGFTCTSKHIDQCTNSVSKANNAYPRRPNNLALDQAYVQRLECPLW
jgi:hypothetical protein